MTNLTQAIKTIETQVAALNAMASRMGTSFDAAVQTILEASGRLVVVGMGKSGIIGQKIAATMASTGQSSFFVHPGEAYHGDLGMIRADDVVLLISNSGETEEVIRLLPFLEHQQNKVIALTGKLESTLAKHANVVLDVGVEREACNINLAPTSSTTCTLVMGDALALALSAERNFQPEDFARFHPGGSLGRKLLSRVVDVMHKDRLPICAENDSFRDVVQVITTGRLGLAIVMKEQSLLGVITDGDIRRTFEKFDDCRKLTAREFMSTQPIQISPNMRMADAEKLMFERKVNSLVVVSDDRVIGVLQIFDQL